MLCAQVNSKSISTLLTPQATWKLGQRKRGYVASSVCVRPPAGWLRMLIDFCLRWQQSQAEQLAQSYEEEVTALWISQDNIISPPILLLNELKDAKTSIQRHVIAKYRVFSYNSKTTLSTNQLDVGQRSWTTENRSRHHSPRVRCNPLVNFSFTSLPGRYQFFVQTDHPALTSFPSLADAICNFARFRLRI